MSTVAIVALVAGIALYSLSPSTAIILFIMAGAVTLVHVASSLRGKLEPGTLPYNLKPGTLVVLAGALVAAMGGTVQFSGVPKSITDLIADAGLGMILLGFLLSVFTGHKSKQQ